MVKTKKLSHKQASLDARLNKFIEEQYYEGRNKSKPVVIIPPLKPIPTTARKVKEQRYSTFAIFHKGKAQMVNINTKYLQGTLLGGDKINYEVDEKSRTILIDVYGSISKGISVLRQTEREADPLVKLQQSMLQIQEATAPLRKHVEQVNEIKKKINPLTYSPFNSLFFETIMKADPKLRTGIGSLLTGYNPPKRTPYNNDRKPQTGVGLNRFMTNEKLNNPVLVAKAYKKNQKGLNISGFINLRFLCEQMNVNAEEAFLYVCEGMTSNNSRWTIHRVIREAERGSLCVVNLVKFYREKVEQYKRANKPKFTLMQLYKSEYFKAWCGEYDVKRMSYTDFTKKFKEFQKLVDKLEEQYPKGLLSKQ